MTAVAAAFEALAANGMVAARYREPWRSYHDWSHPRAMIGHLAAAGADGVAFVDPLAAAGFVLWHDAVYDPQAVAGRNERLSAALCEVMFEAAAETVQRAVAAILATIDHRVPAAEACPDGALLLDVDLAILGASAADFDRYDAQIAMEYAHVEPGAYRAGRAAVLWRFLERERLYLTDWGFGRWEEKARANLSRTIARLEA